MFKTWTLGSVLALIYPIVYGFVTVPLIPSFHISKGEMLGFYHMRLT